MCCCVIDMSVRRVLQEAQVRWLKPPEVCDIIEHYQQHNFSLSTSPPNKPGNGALFLFDRKVQRYFRRDGHNWRKKRDNRTVREAHERLKSGSVDVLHCYYAHGQEDYKFQRRCYWMLNPALEHIVLVHYRQTTEGGKLCRAVDTSTGIGGQQPSPSFSGESGEREPEDPDFREMLDDESEPSVEDQAGYPDSLDEQLNARFPEDQAGLPFDGSNTGWVASSTAGGSEVPSGQFGTVGSSSLRATVGYSLSGLEQMLNDPSDVEGNGPCDLASWESMLSNSNRATVVGIVKKEVECASELEQTYLERHGILLNLPESNTGIRVGRMSPLSHANVPAPRQATDAGLEFLNKSFTGLPSRPAEGNTTSWVHWPAHNEGREQYTNSAQAEVLLVSQTAQTAQTVGGSFPSGSEYGGTVFPPDVAAGVNSGTERAERGFEKMDSFSKWVEDSLVGDDSLVSHPGHTGSEWPASLADNSAGELSSDMMLDVGVVSPSLSQQQKFNIVEFSPEWSFCSVKTKVLITGSFLDSSQNPAECKWSVMFGEVEVPAVFLSTGVLSCFTPDLDAGRVPFYITCSNREACSQVREFEFRMNSAPSPTDTSALVNDLVLQTRLSRMLLSRVKSYRGSNERPNIDSGVVQDVVSNEEWSNVQSTLEGPSPSPQVAKDLLSSIYLRRLFKLWLHAKILEGEKEFRFFDEKGQGVLHLVAALGYCWGISPLLAAGSGINFRDARGWTALHWAAVHGREEAVALLLASGATPALKTDPTPKEPAGHTPADLAQAHGYAGIAAYLAEAALASRLSAITLSDKNSSEIVDTPPLRIDAFVGGDLKIGSDESYPLDTPYSAVEKATKAALEIQALNRQKSWIRKQQAERNFALGQLDSIPSVNEQLREMYAAKTIQKAFRGHHTKKKLRLNSAAILIQRRYRGYKGRKAFLNIRSKVVRIQATVRGHLVRKQYKKLLWSVGILEKAVLRWHRKRNGFRNFNMPNSDSDLEDIRKPLKDQFNIEIWEDVNKIRSIVNDKTALDSYNRVKILEQHGAEQLSSPSEALGIDRDASMAFE